MTNKLIQDARAAEAAVLGSMVLDREQIDVVAGVLRGDDFGTVEHRLIYEGLLALVEAGDGQIDLVLLRDHLQRREQLDAVGGVDYLVKVAEATPTAANSEHYARAVKDHSTRRSIGMISQCVFKRCLTPDGADAEQIRAEAVQDLNDIDAGDLHGPTPISAVAETMTLADADIFESTGLRSLDDVLIGWKPGDFNIVGARPSMGKTALLLLMAEKLAVAGKSVIFYSLEMSESDLLMRLICGRAGLALHRVVKGRLSGAEKKLFYETRDTLGKLPLFFDTKSLSPTRLRSSVLAARRRGQCDLVVIDYLGLMSPDVAGRSKYEDVSAISYACKRTALDAGVPVIAGCQLNRANIQRNDKRPTMADLRDSGSIEQDADVVMLLHREAYYRPNDDQVDQAGAEAIIAKNRRGPTTTIDLKFCGIYARFEEPEPVGQL